MWIPKKDSVEAKVLLGLLEFQFKGDKSTLPEKCKHEVRKSHPKFILKTSTEMHQILKTTEFLSHTFTMQKLDTWDAFGMFDVTISILQCKQVLLCSYLQVQQERHNMAKIDHKQESGATTLHKLLVICIWGGWGAFHNWDWTQRISCSQKSDFFPSFSPLTPNA